MPVINIPLPESGMNTEQLANLLAMVIKEVQWLANGNIDSGNVRNIAGYNVDRYTLRHESGIVGMSGQNPSDPNAVRFWSGDADPTKASFRVTQAGILTAVGALLMSALGYPRVEINGTNNSFAAYKTADTYVDINPNLSANVPGIQFLLSTISAVMYLYNPGTPEFFIATPLGKANIEISSGLDLLLNPAGNLKINGANGYTGTISYVKNVVSGSPTFGTINVNKGIITSVS
jgi:hypothetical protein